MIPDENWRSDDALDGYVGDDGRLEVWLLDEHATLTDPVRKLGEVTIPADLLADGLTVEIEARKGEDGNANQVTLLDAAQRGPGPGARRHDQRPDRTGRDPGSLAPIVHEMA